MQEIAEVTNEDIIAAKIACFEAGYYDVLDLSAKQLTAMELLTDNETDEIGYGGGGGGGKSWQGCEWLLWSCLTYPDTRWFVGRKQLKQIRRTTVVTFNKVCRKHGIPRSWWRYNPTEVTITFYNGSVIEGLELDYKPSDPDFDGVGSTEYTGGWIEEAGGVPFKAYDVLKARIGRHYNDKYGVRGKMFVTFNPSRNWLYNTFYTPWKKGLLPAYRRFVQSLVGDNTHREAGYEERLQKLTGAVRARLYLGDWEYDDDPLALIQYDAIVDLFSNDYIRPDNLRRYLVCDVAMHGSDLFRIGVFYGDVLVEYKTLAKSGGRQVVAEIKAMQARHVIRPRHIIYDADGVGAFVGQKGGFIPLARAFHGNGSPLKKDNDPDTEYANLRAQCGYLLAEKINDGLMWAKAVTEAAEQEMLSEELAQVKMHKADSDEKKRLRKKELIVKDLGRSPDFADIFLMRQWFDLNAAIKRPAYDRPIGSY